MASAILFCEIGDFSFARCHAMEVRWFISVLRVALFCGCSSSTFKTLTFHSSDLLVSHSSHNELHYTIHHYIFILIEVDIMVLVTKFSCSKRCCLAICCIASYMPVFLNMFWL